MRSEARVSGEYATQGLVQPAGERIDGYLELPLRRLTFWRKC